MGALVSLESARRIRQEKKQAKDRLHAILLRDVPLPEPHYSNMQELLVGVLEGPGYPDLSLDDDQFIRMERLGLEMDRWMPQERDEALTYALYHFRCSLKLDPYSAPSVRSRLEKDHAEIVSFRSIFGYLGIIWQIKTGHHSLVLSHKAFREAHPDMAPGRRKPRQL